MDPNPLPSDVDPVERDAVAENLAALRDQDDEPDPEPVREDT